jgi:hypothetical protein
VTWWKRIKFGLAIAGEISAAAKDGKITRSELVRIVVKIVERFNFEIRV